jgi:predicted transcriptional regulator of viral defense system
LTLAADRGQHGFSNSSVSQIIRKNLGFSSNFEYDLGMDASLSRFIDNQLLRGRAYFDRAEALAALDLKPTALAAAVTRQIKKRRLASPRHGFLLILRPEDQAVGAPDPVRWIDALMKHQGLDYRISLLRAGAFHGSSHQAAMTFQVVVPKQLRNFEIGTYRLEFLYQASEAFAEVNQPELLDRIKSEAGFAKVAGVELTLLDCVRYFHRASGLSGVAQIVKDIGDRANPRRLAKAASAYENSVVRRLGYLLDRVGHKRQSKALEPFVKQAKTAVRLDPAVKPLFAAQETAYEKDMKWKLEINEPVEIDF